MLNSFLPQNLILIGLYFLVLPVAMSQGLPVFQEAKSLGSPIQNVVLNDAAYGVEEGDAVVYSTSSGKPARFQVVNLETGKLLRSFILEGSESSWTHITVPNGDVYIGGNGILYKYDYKRKEVEALGGIGEKVIYGLSHDPQGRVYFGSFPNAKIGRYDPSTGDFTDFGNVAPGQKYSRSTAYHNGHVYAGIGTENKLGQLNLTTGESKIIPLPEDVEHGSSIWQLDVANNYLIAGVGGGKNTLLLFDLKSKEWTSERFHSNKGIRLIYHPDKENIVYFLQNEELKRLDLRSKKLRSTGLKYGSFIRNSTWIDLEDPTMPGRSLVLLYQTGKVSFFNLETGKIQHRQYPFQGGNIPIQTLEKGPDGALYMSGYPGGTGASYSPEDQTFSTFGLGQAEGMTSLRDTMYYGIYPKARIYRHHPTRGPEFVYQIPHQDRPFIMKEDGKELVIGTIPDYGKLGGSLTFLDPARVEQVEIIPEIIEDQAIAGLAIRGDTVYGSTTIAGGLGIEPEAEHAVVFRFDKKKMALIDKVQPLKNPVDMISGMHFGPKGNLWAAADGMLIELDPKDLTVIRSLSLHPKVNNYGRWRPAQFHWHDGYLYTTLGGYLSVVNPETFQYKILGSAELMTTDARGDIYYVRKTELMLLKRENGLTDIGIPLRSVAIPGAAYGKDLNGEPRIYAVTGGNPARINEIDLRTGEVVQSSPLSGASNSWAVTSAPHGKVYIGTYSNAALYEYDSYSDQLHDLGTAIKGEKFIWRIDHHADGKIYGGTYPSGKVFEYDPQRKQFRDYGQVTEGRQYVRSLSVAGDTIFVGTGTSRAGFAILDRTSGKSKEIKLPPPYDSETVVYDMDVRGDLVFLRVSEKSDILVYDRREDEYVNIIPKASGLDVSAVSPESETVYLSVEGRLHSYDLRTHTLNPTSYKNFGTSRGFGWYKDLDPQVPGWYLVSISHDGQIRRYHPKTDSFLEYAADLEGGAVSIQSLEKGPDGNIYVGGYFSGGLGKFDVESKKLSQYNGIGQIEGMTSYGESLFMGVYTGAEIYSYNPGLPFEAPENPRFLYSLRNKEQDRPFAMVPAGNRVAIGTVPSYGKLGGSLSFYVPEKSNNDFQFFDSVVEDQSIISLASKNGTLYGGTSVWGGLGSTPTKKNARIFLWDLEKNKKIKDFIPIPGERAISALALENEKKLWGLTLGTIFSYDLIEEKITWKKELFPVNWSAMSHLWRGGAVEFTKDGNLLIQARNRIYQINAVTKQVKLLAQPASLMAVDDKGNIYFARKEHLLMLTPEKNE